jgi:DNA-binding MarR family transcriptional regulator
VNKEPGVAVQILDHPVVQVFDIIRRIDDGVRDAIGESLPEGLTLAQYAVLRLMDVRGDGVGPAELAQALNATKSGMTATLQGLEAGGFVRIELCADDKRKKRAWLTPKGCEAYTTAVARIRPKMERLREAFTTDEFHAALPFLKALNTWFEQRDWA